MKITKRQLKRIIKEEIEDTLNQQVYIVAEPSTTYEGEFTEIRLLGVFLDKTAAMTAARKAFAGGYVPDVFAVPVGEIDPDGYAG
jgi:hypothetical protein